MNPIDKQKLNRILYSQRQKWKQKCNKIVKRNKITLIFRL